MADKDDIKEGKDFAAAKPELKRIIQAWCDSKSK